MWFIWKNINKKVYNNKNGNPSKIILVTKIEEALWTEIQIKYLKVVTDLIPPQKDSVPSLNVTMIDITWCFVDGTWKKRCFYRIEMVLY